MGLANNESIEVKEGLKSGETVVLNPAPFLTADQKRRLEQSNSSPQRSSRPKTKPGHRGKPSPDPRPKEQAGRPEDRDEPKDSNPSNVRQRANRLGVPNVETRSRASVRRSLGLPCRRGSSSHSAIH